MSERHFIYFHELAQHLISPTHKKFVLGRRNAFRISGGDPYDMLVLPLDRVPADLRRDDGDFVLPVVDRGEYSSITETQHVPRGEAPVVWVVRDGDAGEPCQTFRIVEFERHDLGLAVSRLEHYAFEDEVLAEYPDFTAYVCALADKLKSLYGAVAE